VLPQLVGIAALAALCVTASRSESNPDRPFELAVRELRVGMTLNQAVAAMDIGRPSVLYGSALRHWHRVWFSHKRHETLILHFMNDQGQRLTAWRIDRN
jgi:hypothetical protein